MRTKCVDQDIHYMVNILENSRKIKYDWVHFWKLHGKMSFGKNPHFQALRTCNGQPIPDSQFNSIVNDLEDKLQLKKEHELLDLCCGNGSISEILAEQVHQMVAVDVSDDLLAAFKNNYSNINKECGDVRDISFTDNSFDRIVLYAALQYFTLQETKILFEKMNRWLRKGGCVVLGDIPDFMQWKEFSNKSEQWPTELLKEFSTNSEQWAFFDNSEWRLHYSQGIEDDNVRLIGTWFNREWLRETANFAGFAHCDIISQDKLLPFSHYRFDAVLYK